MPVSTSTVAASTTSNMPGTKTEQVPLRYLRYLPAIYQELASLLPSYLYPFEERIDTLRSLLGAIDNYVTPGMTPADDFLPWLAGWVALTLDDEWEENRRRQLISQAVELYRWRGTVTGMRRFLELYTGLPLARIEVREGRWPGGIQIGISSRIGGFNGGPPPSAVVKVERKAPLVQRDYYVVTGKATASPATQATPSPSPTSQSYITYFATEDVTRVDDTGGTVTIWRRDADAPDTYPAAAVTRRNDLPEDVYALTPAGEPEPGPKVTFTGDTRCITEVKRPYSFIVRLLLSPADFATLGTPERLNKVKAIIELEKPAHTICYLRLDRYRPQPAFNPMQIGVQSTIGLDTYLR
jgi:phage tail-like protein